MITDEQDILLDLPETDLRKMFFLLTERKDIAHMLCFFHEQLTYFLYIAPTSEGYITLKIPKKSGGTRTIHAPTSSLKIMQKRMNQVLQAIYQPHENAHGFIPGRSIVTNAIAHYENGINLVFNIDLLDFFPSIKFERVKDLFLSPPLERNLTIASTIAKLCCYKGLLPQGAPTSPMISNMVCTPLDNSLTDLAHRYECKYTRYGDDITFTTKNSNFPKNIVAFDKSGAAIAGYNVREIINNNGFDINRRKVWLRRKSERQEIAGIVVNDIPNVRRKFVRQIRAMLHAWRKFGLMAAEEEYNTKYSKFRSEWHMPTSYKAVLRGKINFLGMVRGKDNPMYVKFYQQYTELAENNN